MKKFIVILISMVIIAGISCSNDENQASDDSKSNVKNNSAVMVFLIGNIRVKKGDIWKQGEMNMKLSPGDVIETGPRSKCNIVIGKDSYVSIKQNSKLSLDKLIINEDGTEETDVELKVGKGIINPKKLLKGDSFNVKTPTAIAAVRGTKFVVETAPNANAKVSVVEGKIAFKKRVPAVEAAEAEGTAPEVVEKVNQKIEEETVTLEANQTAEIDNKKAEELNDVVEEVIEEVETSKNAEAASDSAVTGNGAASNGGDASGVKVLDERLSEIDENVSNTVEVKVSTVENKDKEEVEELDNFVDENEEEIQKTVEKVQVEEKIIEAPASEAAVVEEKPVEKKLQSTKLVVRSPVKNSKIYINGKYRGYGAVEYNLQPNTTAKVFIKTKGYKDFSTDAKWIENENITINPSLEKTDLLDRMAWTVNFKDEVKGQIVPYRSNMFIIPSAIGNIYAINDRGDIIWKKKLSGGIDSTPVLKGNNIYVVTNNGSFYSINAASGRQNFLVKIEGALLFGASPLLTKKDIFIGTTAGYLYRIDYDGKIKLEKDINYGIYSTLAFDGKRLYFGTDSKKFVCVDADDGDFEWIADLDSRVIASKAVIYQGNVITATYKGELYSFNMRRGKLNWKKKLNSSVVVDPIVVGNRAVYAVNNGVVVLVDLNSGKTIWRKRLQGNISNTPQRLGNSLYVVTNRNVYKLNFYSGASEWNYRVSSNIKTNVTVAGNNILIGSVNGDVYSLRIDLRTIIK